MSPTQDCRVRKDMGIFISWLWENDGPGPGLCLCHGCDVTQHQQDYKYHSFWKLKSFLTSFFLRDCRSLTKCFNFPQIWLISYLRFSILVLITFNKIFMS